MIRFEKARHIFAELKGHAPFTLFGALAGVAFMLLFRMVDKVEPAVMFKIFHPGHVILSAMVTASLFSLHEKKKNYLLILIVGYVGSIGVATLSDCVVPYAGEKLFGLDIPAHAAMHDHDTAHEEGEPTVADNHIHTEDCEHEEVAITEHIHDENCEHDHKEIVAVTEHVHDENCEHEHAEIAANEHGHEGETAVACDLHDHGKGLHLGFIEEWYIVNPAALLGVLIAFIIPRSKCPHAAHVLISTWATGSHILMNMQSEMTIGAISVIFFILFVAVLLPCCISDIVFPLLFVRSDLRMAGSCGCHKIHSHGHEAAKNGENGK